MPKPLSPTRLGNLKQKIKDRFIQGCGEQQIGYRVEVLDVMARWAAEESLEERSRNGPPLAVEVIPIPPPLPAPPLMPFGMTVELLDVLELLVLRLTDRQVAERLGLTERQVKRLLRELYVTLGAGGRFESVVAGYEHGFLGPAARRARKAAAMAPAPAEPPGEGAAPPGTVQAATGAAEGLGGRR